MTSVTVPATFVAERAAVDSALAAVCDALVGSLPVPVEDAVRYALRGGGKRLRAILLLCSYHAAGGVGDASGIAAAIEIVHAYSLVHDDLPCMDDDDMRRGRPSVHRVYGVSVATVAGLAMLPLAVGSVARSVSRLNAPEITAHRITAELMRAAGAAGMIGGQLLDLEAEGGAPSLAALEAIHQAKTGALIEASARIGGIAAGAAETAIDALGDYAAALGLAFQIVDDILDVTASTDQLGKQAGRDVALSKSTYPALLGVCGATDRARTLVQGAVERLDSAGLLTADLRHIADLVITRTS